MILQDLICVDHMILQDLSQLDLHDPVQSELSIFIDFPIMSLVSAVQDAFEASDT